MLDNLIQLTSDLLEKNEVGTLFLGKGESARRLFFSGEEVYLLADRAERRVVPVKQLFQTERISPAGFESLVARLNEEAAPTSEILARGGLLREEDREQYDALERLEQVLWALERAREVFNFESGNVPEEILRFDPGLDHGVPADALVAAIRHRIAEAQEMAIVYPRSDELPVLSESGIAAQNNPANWLFAQVATLVDGFRTIHRILEDSRFFPHRTLQILYAATRKGWARKTLFREFQDFDQREFTPEQASLAIQRLESAAEVAVDDLPLRRHLVRLHQLVDRADLAAQQLELIGDAHLGRRDKAKALATYQAALELVPENAEITRKVFDLYLREAAAAQESGNGEETRHWLERAADLHPARTDLRLQVIDTYADPGQVVHEATRQADELSRHTGKEEVLDFLVAVLQRVPEAETLRRRRVNLLLDLGRNDEAIRELDLLAAQLVDAGESERAHEILQKIGRLDPKRAIAREVTVDSNASRPRRWRPSMAAVSLAILFVGFGVYQHVVYREIEAQREAFADLVKIDISNLGDEAFRQEAERSRSFLQRVVDLEAKHPFTIWVHPMQQIRLAAEQRVDFIESTVRRELNELLSRAREAHVRGRLDEAHTLYVELESKVLADDGWKDEARVRIEEIARYRTLSRALRDRAAAAEEAGRLEEAFHLYRELLIEYPRAEAARGMRLPLRIDSRPTGAQLSGPNGPLGTTPVTLRVLPWESLELHFALPDGRQLDVTIDDPLEHEQIFRIPEAP